MEEKKGNKVKVIEIYKSEVGEARIYYDQDPGTMVLKSEAIGSVAVERPEDSIGGAYTAREIAEGWLNEERLTGMAGEWQHAESDIQDNKDRIVICKWMKEGVTELIGKLTTLNVINKGEGK